jgi:hypothetical protein
LYSQNNFLALALVLVLLPLFIDFDSLIPGHGGFTDRMDCQFIMGMATWIAYTSFVQMGEFDGTVILYFVHFYFPISLIPPISSLSQLLQSRLDD